jgi:tetratricopeptide (TPR) repeat protein
VLKVLVALCLLPIPAVGLSAEYGHYHLNEVFLSASSGGALPIVNLPILNRIVNDLNTHAGAAPVRFDSPDDLRRAQADAKDISAMLDPFTRVAAPDLKLLQSAAAVNAIGMHLNVSDSRERADASFRALMKQAPDDPRGNYLYGKFLLETGKTEDAIVRLEKAQSLGVIYADYALGMAYLSEGDSDKALHCLERYSKRAPGDTYVIDTINAIRGSSFPR